jgi:lysophospholipase L1-like esterase
MSRTVKILTAVIISLIVISGTQTYLLATSSKEALSEPIRIACVGDSITRGTEYTLDLWAHLGPDYVIGDFGVGGATVSLQSEAAYMNKTAFETAKAFQPDIVIVMLGTNDADRTLNETKQQFIADYITLLSAFESLPNKPQIYIAQPPPIYNVSLSLSGEIFASMVQPSIAEVARQTGITVIDAYTPLLGHPDLFIDGIHPTAAGAQLIADAVYAAVNWPIRNASN